MALWNALYGIIWLMLLEFLTVLILPRSDLAWALHAAIGVGIVALAFYNWKGVEATQAPKRTKRIAKTVFLLSALTAILGVPLLLKVDFSLLGLVGVSVFYGGIVRILHVVNAIAVITQVASVATSYDMWEEHEFEEPSGPAAEPAPRAEAPPPTAH